MLRTEDGGYLWQTCTVPSGAEKLDFRGVQGFDAKTAVVMASGPGALSKVYRTTDGCQSWTLVFSNPDEKGFFDALKKVTGKQMYLLGDPVDGNFAMFFSPDMGASWFIADDPGRAALQGCGRFRSEQHVVCGHGQRDALRHGRDSDRGGKGLSHAAQVHARGAGRGGSLFD